MWTVSVFPLQLKFQLLLPLACLLSFQLFSYLTLQMIIQMPSVVNFNFYLFLFNCFYLDQMTLYFDQLLASRLTHQLTFWFYSSLWLQLLSMLILRQTSQTISKTSPALLTSTCSTVVHTYIIYLSCFQCSHFSGRFNRHRLSVHSLELARISFSSSTQFTFELPTLTSTFSTSIVTSISAFFPCICICISTTTSTVSVFQLVLLLMGVQVHFN